MTYQLILSSSSSNGPNSFSCSSRQFLSCLLDVAEVLIKFEPYNQNLLFRTVSKHKLTRHKIKLLKVSRLLENYNFTWYRLNQKYLEEIANLVTAQVTA